MARYEGREVGRIYKVKKKTDWGNIIIGGVFILIVVASCAG